LLLIAIADQRSSQLGSGDLVRFQGPLMMMGRKCGWFCCWRGSKKHWEGDGFVGMTWLRCESPVACFYRAHKRCSKGEQRPPSEAPGEMNNDERMAK